MSWKLAELRWRQDLGLQERCLGREGEPSTEQHSVSTKSQESQSRRCAESHKHRRRCLSLGDDSTVCINQASVPTPPRSRPKPISPDPDISVLSLQTSLSCATPLLKVHDSRDQFSASDSRPISSHKETELLVATSCVREPLNLSSSYSKNSNRGPDSAQAETTEPTFADLTGVAHCPSQLSLPSESIATSATNLQATTSSDSRQTPDAVGGHNLPHYWNSVDRPADDNAVEYHTRQSCLFPFPQSSRDLTFSANSGASGGSVEDFFHRDSPQRTLDWSVSLSANRSQSFSSSIKRTSVASTPRSDSDLLRSFRMAEEISTSAGHRQTSRTLYPDLHSAHAQIQGRRTMSPSQSPSQSPLQTPPSQKETRFPLSPSSISSEEDEQDDFDPLPLERDDIPLQDMSYQRVHSAQGVLREGDHHEESSAILESPDGAKTMASNKGKLSATLDKGDAQYADGPADCSSSSLATPRNMGQAFGIPNFSQPASVGDVHGHPPTSGYCSSSLPGEQQQDPAGRPLETRAGFEDDEGEWETVPESSRSGFLTPAKLRFRLMKKENLEDSTSSLGSRSPATPWDPLSSSRRRNLAPSPLHTRRPLPGQTGHEGSSYGRERRQTTTQTKVKQDFMDLGSHRITDSAGAPGDLPRIQSPRRPRPATTASSTRLTSHTTSALPSTSVFGPTPIRALPSSSLFSRDLETGLVSKTSSRAALKRSKIPTMSNPDHREPDLNQAQGDNNSHFSTSLDTNMDLAGRATADPGRTLEQQRMHDEFGKMVSSSGSQNHILAQQLLEGGYGSSDSEISRFLRDTRHLHTDTTSPRANARRGIKVTGSSLGNYSSDSNSLLARARHGGESSSIYSSLSNVNAAQSNNNSAHGTTASLIPAGRAPGLAVFNGSVDIQRRAGRILLVACVVTFGVGGFVLAHDMGEGGALSSAAMAEVTRLLSGREEGVVARVHPEDARLARAVERVGLLVVVGVLLGCVGVLVWAATN